MLLIFPLLQSGRKMKNLMMISVIAAASVLATACSRNVPLPADYSNPSEKIQYLQALKDNRPDWADKGLWEDGDFVYQVGQGLTFNSEREAKKHANRDASFRLSEYITRELSVEFTEMIVSSAEATEIIEQKTAAKELAKSLSRSVISNIHVDETYTELTVDEDEQVGFTAFTLVKVPKKAIKNAMKYAKSKLESTEQPTELADLDPNNL